MRQTAGGGGLKVRERPPAQFSSSPAVTPEYADLVFLRSLECKICWTNEKIKTTGSCAGNLRGGSPKVLPESGGGGSGRSPWGQGLFPSWSSFIICSTRVPLKAAEMNVCTLHARKSLEQSVEQRVAGRQGAAKVYQSCCGQCRLGAC